MRLTPILKQIVWAIAFYSVYGSDWNKMSQEGQEIGESLVAFLESLPKDTVKRHIQAKMERQGRSALENSIEN